MNMKPFYAIYNKGTYMQFAFNNFKLHPDYIGAEFPLGQSLTAAINISKDEAYKAFNELTSAYMLYLDNKTIDTYNAFLTSIYNMDEYCQILKLHLIEHTESNVKNAIIQLKDNPIIEEITPNYISYSSPIEKNTIETEDGGSICYRNRSIIIIDKPKFNN